MCVYIIMILIFLTSIIIHVVQHSYYRHEINNYMQLTGCTNMHVTRIVFQPGIFILIDKHIYSYVHLLLAKRQITF